MAKGGKKGGGGGGDDGGSETGGVSLRGNRKDNFLAGTNFDDSIRGGLGDDTLIGLDGDDFLFAEGGDDSVEGRGGNDRIFGVEGNNILNGDAGHDEIFGGTGIDIIDGGSGNDTLLGGLGEDTMNGGESGYDTAEFTDIGGYVPGFDVNGNVLIDGITLISTGEKSYETTVQITTDPLVEDPFETDTLTNISRVVGTNFNDHMTGGGGADDFVGAQGDDFLSGGGGQDTLYGGVHNDTLEGGLGEADTFVFLRAADGILEPDEPVTGDTANYTDAGRGDGTDVILDFEVAEDKIVFLTNEDMAIRDASELDGNELDSDLVIGANAAGDAVLSYGGDGFYGVSTVTLVGVAPEYLTDDDIVIMVDADFQFML